MSAINHEDTLQTKYANHKFKHYFLKEFSSKTNGRIFSLFYNIVFFMSPSCRHQLHLEFARVEKEIGGKLFGQLMYDLWTVSYDLNTGYSSWNFHHYIRFPTEFKNNCAQSFVCALIYTSLWIKIAIFAISTRSCANVRQYICFLLYHANTLFNAFFNCFLLYDYNNTFFRCFLF